MKSISAIDVTNPKQPKNIWQGNIVSHGMSLRPDGNRAYLADPDGQLVTLDTSEIQARKPDPQTREISRLTWKSASIPQNALPFTAGGKPYILEFDEYTQGTTGGGERRRGGRRRASSTFGRAQAAQRRPDPASGQPARRPRGGPRRPRCDQPGAGVRGALLRPRLARGPEGRGVLVHRLRPARVRHLRADQAEGDRLLRPAEHGADRERLRRQQLRHVQARDRRRPARGLVLRRRHRVLQPPDRPAGVARRVGLGPRLSGRGGHLSGRATSGAYGSVRPRGPWRGGCRPPRGRPSAPGAGA